MGSLWKYELLGFANVLSRDNLLLLVQINLCVYQHSAGVKNTLSDILASPPFPRPTSACWLGLSVSHKPFTIADEEKVFFISHGQVAIVSATTNVLLDIRAHLVTSLPPPHFTSRTVYYILTYRHKFVTLPGSNMITWTHSQRTDLRLYTTDVLLSMFRVTLM